MYLETTSYNGATIGTTNSNGYVYLYLTAAGFLESMSVTINGGDYEVLTSSNTYTSTSYYLYPVYNLGLDMNQNDVVDVWEMSLAQEFCPKIFQDKKDNDWYWGTPVGYTLAPIPVEAMDLNGDDILDENDVRVMVRSHPDGDILVGDGYRMDEIYVWDAALGFIPYSSLYPELVQRVHEVLGWVDGSVQTFFFMPHYQWATGDASEGNVSWYSAWNDMYTQKGHLTEYNDGIVYVCFDGSGNNPTILYNMHFPFNAAANRHEGDWQGIVVELDSQIPGQADIVSIEYRFHGEKTIRTVPIAYSRSAAEALINEVFWEDGNSNPAFANKYFVDGTHLVAFCGGRTNELGVEGWGSHAMYPSPGAWKRSKGGGLVTIEEYVVENGSIGVWTKMFDFNGYQNIKIIPSKQYVMANLKSDPEYNWVIFGGYWGNVLSFPSADQATFNGLVNAFGGITINIFRQVDVIPDANIAAKSPYGGYYD